MIDKQACEICGLESRFWSSIHGYRHYRCTHCGHLFVHPKPSQEELDHFYAGGKYYEAAEEQQSRLLCEAEERVTLLGNLSRTLGLERKLLDVGCATGNFLGVAVAHGWHAVGVDRSEEIASKASTKLKCTIYAGIFETMKVPEAPFPIVTAWDVIEHARDATELFRVLARTVAPGGLLALCTPRGDGLPAKILGLHFPMLMPPEHLCIFSRRSLAMLANKNGFEELHYMSFSNLSLRSLASGFSKVLFRKEIRSNSRVAQRLCKSFAAISVWIPYLVDLAGYGTEMLVVYQKKQV